MRSDSVVSATRASLQGGARQFEKKYALATSEQAERQTFWNDFFSVFGIDRRQVAVFERLAARSSTGGTGWIDLLFPGQMAVEHKSAGADLDSAMTQLTDYLPSLTTAEHPWLLVVCDFKRFRWQNLLDDTSGEFALSELAENLHLFWWLAGLPRPDHNFENEREANLAATRLLAELYDRLETSGYDLHHLRLWITRILFCLFADDAGVWERAAFHAWITEQTRQDGADLGPQIAYLFQLLDTPESRRPRNLDAQLQQFVYINGDLFTEVLSIPTCDNKVREALLEACTFDWSVISPAIFGSMFQNVMLPEERRQLGAHYTTESNILRTIRPLFLDELASELQAARTKPALRNFLAKLRSLTFFDPACGCGNFLVVSYRELRRLETTAIRELLARERRENQLAIDVSLQFKLSVDQFCGIELEEFPAMIARTAMYLADHLANREASREFGVHYARIPIPVSPHIKHADALSIDWAAVIDPADCHYVFGNPPFAGHVTRSKAQSVQMRTIWGKKYAKWLDYVTCWYQKSIGYAARNPEIRFGFVSTNSIAQGEQVARLWDPLFEAGFKIDFAHQTFAWTSEARGTAQVHVVIVGFSRGPHSSRRPVFSYETPLAEPQVVQVPNISPYLVGGDDLAVRSRSVPLSLEVSDTRYGSLPADGGGLIVKPADRASVDPVAEKYLRRFIGSRELLNSAERWCLWMPNGPAPGDVAKSEFLRRRLEDVRRNRLGSTNPDTIELAEQPYRFFHVAQPSVSYVAIPAQVSNTRLWYTVSRESSDVVASNTIYTLIDPDGFATGILCSRMFMIWLKGVGGRLKSDPRFAGDLVWNTFPLPSEVPPAERSAVAKAADQVIRARDTSESLANLYDRSAMPATLLKAHRSLDRIVDRILGVPALRTDNARLEFLLARYSQML